MLPRHIMSMLGNCLAVLAVLLTGCSGQEIEVDLSNGSNRSVTVPRVNSLLITLPNSYGCGQNSTSVGDNMCRHIIPTVEVTYQLNFTHANTPPLVLTVTVDDTRKVACKHYIFNTSSEQLLNFTCIPVATRNTNNPGGVTGAVIQWRRFINSDEMDQFISGMDTSGRSILSNTSPGNIEITNADGVTNSSILIRSSENQYRVGFYVPTVLLANGDEERTEAFVIYLGPRITSMYEFSFIELVDTRNFDRIRCEVETFPEATVSWTRDGGNLSERVEQRPSNNTDQPTLGVAINGELVFDTVQYSDAGVYDCTATNEYSDAPPPSLAVRLRVHSRLRPLWPAIGILGIAIITPLFILGGHFIDKLWGKIDSGEKDSLVTGGGKRSYSVSDSDNSNNTAGKHYHKAIRRVSSARQELLTESSSV